MNDSTLPTDNPLEIEQLRQLAKNTALDAEEAAEQFQRDLQEL